MSDEVMKVIDELNDFLADVYYPLLDEFQRHEHALTKEKAKEFKEKFEKVLKKLEEFRNTLKEHLARLIAEGKDELASNVKNTIEFIENEMANVIRILERLKRNRHKIAIKWGEKGISLADLVSFSKHAKELHIDGDRKTAIIVEPDEWLLEELENRGVKYEVIAEEITPPKEVKPLEKEEKPPKEVKPTAEPFDIVYQKLVTQFIYVLRDKKKLSDMEAEEVEKEYDEIIRELAERVVRGEMDETDALIEVSRLAEEWKPKIAIEAEPYIKALKDVFITNLMFYKGFSEERAREVAEEMHDEIEKLAIDVVQGKMKYREAIWKIVDMAKEWKPKISKKEVMDTLMREYESFLAEQGVTNPKKVLEFVKDDIESLANEVAEGRMDLEEAIERVRRIPIPPIAKFKAPKAVEVVERAPEEVVTEKVFITTPREAAEILFKYHLPELLLFGFNYVYENYGRKYGIPPQLKDQVAWQLANMLRQIGYELEKSELGRYQIVGDFLTRYAVDVLKRGVLKPLSEFIMHNYWPWLRSNYPQLVEELTRMGIEGCIAKAFEGVLFTSLGVPREKWPDDVIKCYEKMIEVLGE